MAGQVRRDIQSSIMVHRGPLVGLDRKTGLGQPVRDTDQVGSANVVSNELPSRGPDTDSKEAILAKGEGEISVMPKNLPIDPGEQSYGPEGVGVKPGCDAGSYRVPGPAGLVYETTISTELKEPSSPERRRPVVQRNTYPAATKPSSLRSTDQSR